MVRLGLLLGTLYGTQMGVCEPGGCGERYLPECVVSIVKFSVASVMKEVKCGWGRGERDSRGRGESGNCLVSCMQMTWFCVVMAVVRRFIELCRRSESQCR